MEESTNARERKTFTLKLYRKIALNFGRFLLFHKSCMFLNFNHLFSTTATLCNKVVWKVSLYWIFYISMHLWTWYMNYSNWRHIYDIVILGMRNKIQFDSHDSSINCQLQEMIREKMYVISTFRKKLQFLGITGKTGQIQKHLEL